MCCKSDKYLAMRGLRNIVFHKPSTKRQLILLRII